MTASPTYGELHRLSGTHPALDEAIDSPDVLGWPFSQSAPSELAGDGIEVGYFGIKGSRNRP